MAKAGSSQIRKSEKKNIQMAVCTNSMIFQETTGSRRLSGASSVMVWNEFSFDGKTKTAWPAGKQQTQAYQISLLHVNTASEQTSTRQAEGRRSAAVIRSSARGRLRTNQKPVKTGCRTQMLQMSTEKEKKKKSWRSAIVNTLFVVPGSSVHTNETLKKRCLLKDISYSIHGVELGRG